MTDAQVSRKISVNLRIGKIKFGIERRTVIQAERYFFWAHTRVIYSHAIGS